MNMIVHGGTLDVAAQLLKLVEVAEWYLNHSTSNTADMVALQLELENAKRLVVRTDERSQPLPL